MNKQKRSESGFSSIELILIILIVALIVVVGWMVYKNNHKTKVIMTSTISSTKKPAATVSTSSKPTTTTASTNPYVGWLKYCDSQSSLCLYYPTTWTKQSGIGNTGASITDSNNDISVYEDAEPSNCSTSQPGETNQFYVSSINNLASSSLGLNVVGGYFSNQLNGSARYNPYYILTSSSNVSNYGLKVGSAVDFPDAWTCYDYGVVSGEASSQPAGSNDYNSTRQDALSWFSTSEATTSLKVLESINKQ